MPESDDVAPDHPDKPAQPEPATRRRPRPTKLEEAWKSAPKRAREKFVVGYAYEITAILDRIEEQNPRNEESEAGTDLIPTGEAVQ
jgi:hypothetical protein